MSRIEEFTTLMFSALVKGGRVKDLTRMAASYLGNPVNVNSSQLVSLAFAGEQVVGDEQWRMICSNDYADHNRIELIADEKGFGIGPDARVNTLLEGSKPLMSCTDSIARAPIVYVHMLEYTRPFDAEDPALLQTFANVVALSFRQKGRGASSVEDGASAVIQKLITGNEVALETVERNLFENAQFQRYLVAVVDPPENATPEQLGHSFRILSSLFPDAKTTQFSDRMVLLFKAPRDGNAFAELSNSLERVMEQRKQRCGTSLPFGNIMKLREYYFQALSALRISQQYRGGTERVARYVDYALYHLFKTAELSFDVKSLCDPFTDYVLRYDRNYGTSWMRTLVVSVLCQRNHARAAGILGISKSTLKYRLSCIRGLAGGSPGAKVLDDQFRAELSVRALLAARPSLLDEYDIPADLLFPPLEPDV